MINPAVDELAEHVTVKRACELTGRPRGSHYRAKQPRLYGPPPKRPSPPNALTEAEVKRILKTVDSDWTEQPPYISLKPVSEKSLALMPNAVAMLKIVGQRGQDMNLQAIVNDESELAVPDPDLITFPIIKPIHQTVHQMYPGAYVAATLNLYSFISGKVPGFSSSASTAIFKADADRFGGGVDVDMDDIFMD